MLKFGFQGFPGEALGAIVSERRQPALELSLLCRRQLDLVVLEAIP